MFILSLASIKKPNSVCKESSSIPVCPVIFLSAVTFPIACTNKNGCENEDRVIKYLAIYGQGIKKVVVQEADLYPVATYLFLFALEYGRAINARKVFWAVRPSLDAPRTHHILPINHSADKRSDWVRVLFKRHSR